MAAEYDLELGNLPFSLEAEQSVLGAIIVEPGVMTTVMEYIRQADCFYRESHRQLYTGLVSLFTLAKPIDFITVLHFARSEKIFESDEEAKIYITHLIELVPTVSNVGSYAKIVQEKYYLRTLMSAAKEILENCSSGQGDAREVLDSAEQRIYEIRQGREATGLTKIEDIIVETYDHLQKISGDDRDEFLGLSSGFSSLDKITTGLNKSDLIIVAARPAMGKTSFALNIATNVARKSQKSVAVFSLEMTKEQLAARILSSEAGVVSSAMRTGRLSSEEWVRLAKAAQIISTDPIYIDDSSGITVPEMKAKLRRVRNLGLVVIDYLQLMSSPKKSESRVQEVSEITRNLKIMAKELGVPVITLSQLARGPEARSDHRPMLSDLRESGSIEQDADIVLFLYRDAYYNPQTEEHNIAECIVAKNRHGEAEKVKLLWDGQFTRFSSLELFRNEG